MLTRRYYGNHQLADVTARDIAAGDGTAAGSSPPRTPSHGQVTLVAAAAADIAALPAAIAALGELAAGTTADSLVADLYVTWAAQPEPDALAARLGELLARALTRSGPRPRGSRGSPSRSPGPSGIAMQHRFTFRPRDGAGPAARAWPRTG